MTPKTRVTYDTEMLPHALDDSLHSYRLVMTTFVCANCKMSETDHADGKCLYEPTEYKLRVCELCNKALTLEDRFITILSLALIPGSLYDYHLDCLKIANG
jgi:hypothetical protein